MKDQLRVIVFTYVLLFMVGTAQAQPGHGQGRDKAHKEKEHGKKEDKDHDKYEDGRNGKGVRQAPIRYDKVNGNGDIHGRVEASNQTGISVFDPNFRWDKDRFKRRKEIMDNKRVTVCHQVSSGNGPAVTLSISANALKAHLAHGDAVGNCPETAQKRYNSQWLKKRNDYYNQLERSREQVAYSRSVLNYAEARLAQAKAELALMRQQRRREEDIRQKEAVVVRLDQNTSLLQSLVGVTANLLVSAL